MEQVKMKINILTAAIFSVALSSCVQNKDVQQPVVQEQETELEHKLGSNVINVTKIAGKGKILSQRILPIYSIVDGVIAEMSLIEGQEVRKGEVLVKIVDTDLRLHISELESELQKKKYDVTSTCIGLGYKRDSLDLIPKDILESIKTMTGYSHTELQLENARSQLESYVIKAPFNGKLLDVNVDQFYFARKGEPLFYLMDADNLLVRFEVVETQLPLFSVGMPLEFTALAYPDKLYHAELVAIAPNVESTGMVVMTAKIIDGQDVLRPGMTTLVNL